MMTRSALIESLRRERFDLMVVGGGITGCGVALDASLRGLRVALVEKDDFASGTSSRSSKLIHGGLRYLQRLEFGLVREGLNERRELERMAPHLVAPLRFIVPRYARWHAGIRTGLFLYDVLGIGSGYPRHRRLSAARTMELSPMLRPPVGGLSYWDAGTDDARLVWTVARTAAEAGAVLLNHSELVGLESSSPGGYSGRVTDHLTGDEIEVRAKAVVNAAGVWADEVRSLDRGSRPVGIRPSRGTHIVFRASRLPTEVALLLPAGDGRFVFVIPWEDDSVVVGTTDADYEGPLDDPEASEADISYLLDVLDRVTVYRVHRSDVVAAFAGLRPLVGSGADSRDISRRHFVDVTGGGMVTVTGGKLTAWRRMAADAVDAALEAGNFDWRPISTTGHSRLSGASNAPGPGVDRRLWRRYGSHASEVLALVHQDPSFGERLHPELSYLRAEAEYAIRSEMAHTPDDVLARRLRAHITASDGAASCRAWVESRLSR